MNIGNPNEFTLLELAEAVIEITGSRSEIVYEALPTDDPQVRQPDISLARELLGWEPTVQLRDGLQRTLDASGAAALIGQGCVADHAGQVCTDGQRKRLAAHRTSRDSRSTAVRRSD